MHDQRTCECGCGQSLPAPKRADRPARFILGHNRRKPISYKIEDRGYTTPCWIWQNGVSTGGYARTTVNGKQTNAHRAFYEQEHGALPQDLHVDHLCSVRACINPDHHEPVTVAENVRRGKKTKLTHVDVQAIRRAVREGHSQVSVARRFGVIPNHISNIVAGRAWRDA